MTILLCRFEMRGLLVNNEDLLRVNAQLNSEMKRMREQMIEMQRENKSVVESYKDMEVGEWMQIILKVSDCFFCY